MTNDEVQEIIDRAEDEYDRLKDRVHEQYDEIKRLNNIISELVEDIPYLLEIISRNEQYIKVYQDEWIAIRSAEEKIKELKGSDKE